MCLCIGCIGRTWLLTSLPHLQRHCDVSMLCRTAVFSGIKWMLWLKPKIENWMVCKKKNLSWEFGVKRKICPSGSLFSITRQSRTVTLRMDFFIRTSHPWQILIIYITDDGTIDHDCKVFYFQKSIWCPSEELAGSDSQDENKLSTNVFHYNQTSWYRSVLKIWWAFRL